VLSEWVQGTKITVGPPFFNRVMIPITLFLLLLTAVGPLLAWRSTSWESVKRNFTVPAIIAVAAALALVPLGWKPWQDISQFYSMMTISLSVLVMATVASEFLRGARVIGEKTGQNVFASMVQLTRRNTRRYGGYIVHVGVVIMMIGFAGAAFNTDAEKELGTGDSMKIGGYTLLLDSYTQDDNPNYGSESAIINVMKDGKKIDTLYPERRFFKASQQTATIVANRSTLKEDLYLVYTGKSEKDRPIIKAHLNPLVMWIWVGVWAVIFGTAIALVPVQAAVTLKQPARSHASAVEVGD
jgi:cytochrome c-type biogenesis protein CcmF